MIDPHVIDMSGEEERVRHQLARLRGLVDALEMNLNDPHPFGVGPGQAVAHAAADLAAWCLRLDLLRRQAREGGA